MKRTEEELKEKDLQFVTDTAAILSYMLEREIHTTNRITLELRLAQHQLQTIKQLLQARFKKDVDKDELPEGNELYP